MTDTEHDGSQTSRRPNRLINEQSPYLRQHAYNPVDWYAWSEEAFERAARENKPILLSIGYSACHWCHVMERESFENEDIARLMNEYFVSIKVDREEHPDLDHLYMEAVQLLTGHGGWPLTVFLTPEGKPFYGGTYYPPEDRHGMPGFPRVLLSIAKAYRDQPQDVKQNVERLTEALKSLSEFAPADSVPRGMTERAVEALAAHYDTTNGGIGGAPKFPHPFAFSLLLRVHQRTGNPQLADMVEQTLTRMARGGIYDQLGGGFHRYSVDERWLIPHFEKMLYDNALLGKLYLDAARALGKAEFFEVARDTLDYAIREMQSPEGGFYSTQDADSEGEEGRFYVWTMAELRSVVGDELCEIAARYFGVSDAGNFEGRNVLNRPMSLADACEKFGKDEVEMRGLLARIRQRMFEARNRRVKPHRDEKIIAAWNGLMIGALAEGFRAVGERRFLDAARGAADFVLATLWDGQSLKRSYKDGVVKIEASLEDYAMLASGLLDLFQASLEPRYLEAARSLAEVMLARFLDTEAGGFFFTPASPNGTFIRTKPVFDGSTASGNSEACIVLLRLHAHTGETRYFVEAERVLKLLAAQIEQQPLAFTRLLEAVDAYEHGFVEVTIAADPSAPELAQWLREIGQIYLPDLALFVLDPKVPADSSQFVPEPVRGKGPVNGQITAYVCRNRACSAPQTSLEGLKAELRSAVR